MEDFLYEIREEFILEAKDLLRQFQENTLELKSTNNRELISNLFRYLHNLKGTSQSVNMTECSRCVHFVEDYVGSLREISQEENLPEDAKSKKTKGQPIY